MDSGFSNLHSGVWKWGGFLLISSKSWFETAFMNWSAIDLETTPAPSRRPFWWKTLRQVSRKLEHMGLISFSWIYWWQIEMNGWIHEYDPFEFSSCENSSIGKVSISYAVVSLRRLRRRTAQRVGFMQESAHMHMLQVAGPARPGNYDHNYDQKKLFCSTGHWWCRIFVD